MKIAICFAGQPRFIKECFDAINQNMILCNRDHEIKIFCHTWFSEEICEVPLYENEYSSFSGGAFLTRDSVQIINDLYRPESMVVDEPIKFIASEFSKLNFLKWAIDNKSDFGMSKDDFINRKCTDSISNYYSIMKSISLKNEFEIINGGKFDLVVKMRFDNKISRQIKFEMLDGNFFYSEELGKPWYETSDWINISNSENMSKLGSIYNNFEDIVRYSSITFGGWSSESLIKSVIKMNNMEEKTFNFGSQLPGWGKYRS